MECDECRANVDNVNFSCTGRYSACTFSASVMVSRKWRGASAGQRLPSLLLLSLSSWLPLLLLLLLLLLLAAVAQCQRPAFAGSTIGSSI